VNSSTNPATGIRIGRIQVITLLYLMPYWRYIFGGSISWRTRRWYVWKTVAVTPVPDPAHGLASLLSDWSHGARTYLFNLSRFWGRRPRWWSSGLPWASVSPRSIITWRGAHTVKPRISVIIIFLRSMSRLAVPPPPAPHHMELPGGDKTSLLETTVQYSTVGRLAGLKILSLQHFYSCFSYTGL
jgi:hypothetical protein